MTIEAAELKIYEPELINDTGTNGGYMSANEITSGSSNNLFPDIPQAERTAGSTKYRKLFFKVADASNGTLYNAKLSMSLQTVAEDHVVFMIGSQSNAQGDLTGSEDQHGCGDLDSTVVATDTSIDVYLEEPTLVIFRVGEKVLISDGTNSEYRTIATLGALVGNVRTLTIDALQNGYSSTNTLVSSVYEDAVVSASYASFSVTSVSGAYDHNTYPLALKNIGSVYDDFTITFTSATTFTCAGAKVGAIGSGNITSNFQPVNTDFSENYFVLDWNGFSGTFATNDTITFTTFPANIPVWTKRVVPAGAASLTGNKFRLFLDGESS